MVELKFFCGMEANEIVEVLQVSTKTLTRDWNFARVWLARQLAQRAGHA
ncbi:MAG: ECF-type sigma factor [Verrucomicrobiota bacterium]|nr:ECF-type sigma factor [Verrucomicrobiota bacterium]